MFDETAERPNCWMRRAIKTHTSSTGKAEWLHDSISALTNTTPHILRNHEPVNTYQLTWIVRANKSQRGSKGLMDDFKCTFEASHYWLRRPNDLGFKWSRLNFRWGPLNICEVLSPVNSEGMPVDLRIGVSACPPFKSDQTSFECLLRFACWFWNRPERERMVQTQLILVSVRLKAPCSCASLLLILISLVCFRLWLWFTLLV